MTVSAWTARALVAGVLLVAGGAKASDLPAFGATVRLFLPLRTPPAAVGVTARSITAAEVLLGVTLLAVPSLFALSVAALVATGGFLAVSIVGFGRYRGRACNCFGGLGKRGFTLITIARNVLLAAVAGAGVFLSQRPSALPGLGLADHLLLTVTALLVTGAAYAAARAVALVPLHQRISL